MATYQSIEAGIINPNLKVHRAVFSKWNITQAGGFDDTRAVQEASLLRDTKCAECRLRPSRTTVGHPNIRAGECSQIWPRQRQTPHSFLFYIRVEAVAKRGTFKKRAARCAAK